MRTPLTVTALAAALLSGCAQPSLPPLLSNLANAQRGTPAEQRAAMVQRIRADVRDAAASADTPAFEQALGVIGTLPREDFVPPAGRPAAYVDLPQAIGFGQTISDPFVVAVMTGALDLPAGANVLDVGTGSGYQAAVLARIARHVSSIEIVAPLARAAAVRLRRLGFANVDVRSGDGFLGWPEHAPFDGIVVAASVTAVPAPLLAQLKPGGRIIIPVGATDASTQLLKITKRTDGGVERCSLGGAVFVPMTGGRVRPQAAYGLIDQSIPLCFGAPIVGVL